ncbi:MAG: 2-oxo acid dehydrogenase subunit E2, partial [Propionibacteriaceae bacterium]|nr:2-oxo acid dehydrogenase subunit E2 [Propionibacteriaceae bacterium]
MSASDSNDLFGANSWLIDEMREAYDADPQSVDATWREYFAAEGAPPSAPAKPEPKAERPVSPETKQREAASGATTTPAAAPAKPAPAAAPATPAAPTADKPKVEKVTTGRNAPHNPGTGTSLSANAPNPNVRPEPTSAEPKYTVLRGAPMRTAKNMETSLSVPTATSVRSVPMKLVIDQRTQINNFLRQSKGGKVSFTHIVGFAMVQALKAMPEMNNAYDVVDGKPNLIENPAINLGIAIDIKKGDTRQLLVPNIKGCENFNFFQFWSAYEQVVQKTRAGDLQVSDFAG